MFTQISDWTCEESKGILNRKQSKEQINETCQKIKQDLIQFGLSHMIFTDIHIYNHMKDNKHEFFEMQFAPMIISGLIESFNDYAVRDPNMDKKTIIDEEKKRLNWFLNCNWQSIGHINAYESGNDQN